MGSSTAPPPTMCTFPDPNHLFLPMKLSLPALLAMAIPPEGIELATLAVCSLACSGTQPNSFYIYSSCSCAQDRENALPMVLSQITGNGNWKILCNVG